MPDSSLVSSTFSWRFIARITFAIPPRSVEKPLSDPTAWRLARVSCSNSW